MADGVGGRKVRVVRPIIATAAVVIGSFYLADYVKRRRHTPSQSVMFPSISGLTRRQELPSSLLPVSLPEHKETLVALIVANVAVFAGWRFFPYFFSRHFSHAPYTGKSYTMFTSMFSHVGAVHLAFNMIALWSFGQEMHKILGRENFLAFYMSCGAVGGLAQHLLGLATRSPASSLGASGALFGFIAFVYDKMPDANLLLFFAIPATARTIIPALVAFDVVGLTGLWRRTLGWNLGHGAHLGGFAAGYLLSQTMFYPPTRAKINMHMRKWENRVRTEWKKIGL